MSQQKVFKKGYIEYLKNNINIADYLGDAFPYDASQTNKLYGIEHPEGLLEKLDPSPDGDLQSAIAIYEAYKDISPLLAQQDDLWVYLTHVDLFKYVKQRWPIIVEDGVDIEKVKNHIRLHWHHHPTHFLRTTFAGLWWNVFLTYDEKREDPYELTRILFKNKEFQTSSFGELPLIRYKEAAIGILEFLKDNEALFESGFNAKARYIRQIFNILGGCKNLSSLNRHYFKEILYKNKNVLAHQHDVNMVKAGAKVFDSL